MVGIINYGMGNLRSVQNAFEYLGVNTIIVNHPEELDKVDRICLPGVGAFQMCKLNLEEKGFIDALNYNSIQKAKPTIGICLGMQIMANKGFEGGVWDGLGWFDAEVIKINNTDSKLKVPNIGWEDTIVDASSPLFKGLSNNAVFYFVHSYFMQFNSNENIVAHYDLSFQVTAAILKDNIFATQFHPEKSQDAGLKVLENFIMWKP